MKQGHVIYAVEFLALVAEFFGDKSGVLGHANRMAVGIRVLCVDKSDEGLHGFIDYLIVTLVAFLIFSNLRGSNDIVDQDNNPDSGQDHRSPKQGFSGQISVECILKLYRHDMVDGIADGKIHDYAGNRCFLRLYWHLSRILGRAWIIDQVISGLHADKGIAFDGIGVG